jgi:outer membrane protein assembly factor BamB
MFARKHTLLATVVLAATISPGLAQARPGGRAPQDQSVAFQIDPAHDGHDSASTLVPPLTKKWSRDFGAGTSVSYPLIASGKVFVTVSANDVERLIALDEATGQTIWSQTVSGTYGFANAAYDSGKVFAINFDGILKAFDATTGAGLWSEHLPLQYAFTSPPTAVGGIVYTGGAGSGGTLYAVDETNGAVLWSQGVENGDHSSPAITSRAAYVSYSCPQAYDFDRVSGTLIWHYSGSCEGGGGKTAVYYRGKVYVRDEYFSDTNGDILDGRSGLKLDGFNSDRAPAFFGSVGLYLYTGTLTANNVDDGTVLWSFAGDGTLSSAAIVVNRTIYVGGTSGMLYALDGSGHTVWSTNVGAPILAPDEHNAVLTTGLGAGDGLVVVPASNLLIAYGE